MLTEITIPATNIHIDSAPGQDTDIQICNCYIRASDLPTELQNHLEINPRDAKHNAVYNGITKTLNKTPGRMYYRNSGLTITAESISHHNGQLKITLSKKHGIANGGHTSLACWDNQDNTNIKNAYLPVRIFVGVNKQMALDIANCQNTNTPVKPHSIADNEGAFDDIKKVLQNKNGDQISYYEGCPGTVPISEIIQIINSLNPDIYSLTEPDITKAQPHEYGRSKESFQRFRDNQHSSKLLINNLLPEILWLHDEIIHKFKDHWNNDGSKLGSLEWAVGKKGKASTRLLFHNIAIKAPYKVPFGIICLIISAFRANIKLNTSRNICEWRMPIQKLSDEVLEQLITQFRTMCKSAKGDKRIIDTMIKDKPYAFDYYYNIVANHLRQNNIPVPYRTKPTKK